jgi:hypothetical protein
VLLQGFRRLTDMAVSCGDAWTDSKLSEGELAMARNWSEALRRAALSGAVAAGTTSACVALAGARDSGSAVAPLNATSHIAWGESAGKVEKIDARHTLLGMALNFGACVFWATFYERYFGRAAERTAIGTALLGGGAVAAAAYVTDYHVVPKRLTPGWEYRVSNRSLAVIYTVLALSLPLRGLLRLR